MQEWTFKYNDYTIEVKNTMTKCELYLNGELKVEHKGLDFGADLSCDLENGEKVLAILRSGWSEVNCNLYIIKEELKPVSEK